MMEVTPQKLNEVPDNEVFLRAQPRSSEALRPVLRFVHSCTRDVLLSSLIVKVVCHRANGHKVRDKCFDVLEGRKRCAEQEFVTRLPDPLDRKSVV